MSWTEEIESLRTRITELEAEVGGLKTVTESFGKGADAVLHMTREIIDARKLVAKVKELNDLSGRWAGQAGHDGEKIVDLESQLRDKDARIKEDSGVIQDLFEEAKEREAEIEKLKDSHQNLTYNNTKLGSICEKHMQTVRKLEADNESLRVELGGMKLVLESTEYKLTTLRDKKCECEWCPVHSV